MRFNLAFCVHALPGQNLKTFWVFAHAVCSAVEYCSLAIGAEYFEVQHREDGASRCQSYKNEAEIEGLLCCAGGLFTDGQVLPGYAARVIDYGD